MKHVYLSIGDIGDGLDVVDGKVKVSGNYLTVAQSDNKYQPVGEYAGKDETQEINDKIDGLSDVYQPLGNYITSEEADENYVTSADLQLYVARTELEEYATKEYVDEALAGFDGSGGEGSGGGFNGNYVGNSKFTGDMEVTGEITVPSIYDKVGSRQILTANILTTEDLNDLLPGLGGGGAYELPKASDTTLGGVLIGSGINVDEDGRISVNASENGGSEYVLPIATANTLGGVTIGDGINIDENGKISVSISGDGNLEYTLPTATAETLGGVKIGSGLTIDGNGVVSAVQTGDGGSSEPYELPTASATVLGGVKVGTGLSISNGVLSSSIREFDGNFNGNMSIIGDLVVSGDIHYKGEIFKQEPGLDYKPNTVKALFEHGRFIVGSPVTSGEIIYEEDGTFSDGANYHGKMTSEGYLDLSVQNQIITNHDNCNMKSVNCFAYFEIVGKLSSANSIFAPLVRQDKSTAASDFLGTKNGTTTQQLGTAMTDGLNRVVIVPTSGGNARLYVNGAEVGNNNVCMARPTSSTNGNLMLGYCWAAGGTGLLKKLALISYNDYGYQEGDGILISKEGFKDTPAPTLMSLRANSEIKQLNNRIDELYDMISRIASGAVVFSQNHEEKPRANFKRK